MAIPISGRVVSDALAHRMPQFDRIFTLGNAFHLSQRYFRRYGRFMPIRVPDPPAIMHWTYPLPLRMEGARNVYTLHDLVPLRLPFTSLEDKRYYDKLIRTCLRTADHIVTVSEASRQDILDLFPVEPAKVTNTYQAVTPSKVANLDEETIAARLRYLFDLEMGNYFLFYGAVEPKKNVGRLIEAYLAAELKTPLVIAGARAWRADEELRVIEAPREVRPKAARRIRRLEYLPSEQLHTLVRGAKAVTFPSLYEGFGLPALEAMMAGVPTMVGNTASLPEVTGDAALHVDPYDVRAMAEALRRLDADATLRRRLSRAGLERAKGFSMEVYASRLNALHMSLLGRGGQPAAAEAPATQLAGAVA
jgi:glycosyltransferase involved in cell wall biosynthesis